MEGQMDSVGKEPKSRKVQSQTERTYGRQKQMLSSEHRENTEIHNHVRNHINRIIMRRMIVYREQRAIDFEQQAATEQSLSYGGECITSLILLSAQ